MKEEMLEQNLFLKINLTTIVIEKNINFVIKFLMNLFNEFYG